METLIYSHDFAGTDWGFKDHQFVDYNQACQQPFKIAALPVMYDEPGNFCYNADVAAKDFSKFDLILLSSIEPVSPNPIKEWANKKNFKKYLLVTGSLERGQPLLDNSVYRPWWAFNIVNSNKLQTQQNTTKPYRFDVLLGARRTHRDFVMLSLQKNSLLDQNIVSYRNIFVGNDSNDQDVTNYFDPLKLTWPYVSPALTPDLEVRPMLDRSISSCVPWKIYQQTYFSIIAETLGTGGAFFLSEKTGKAFYARRAFVHFGICGFLQQLKALGFRTFHTVWDESYDSIENNIDRWQRAMDSVEYIIKQDPELILAQCQDILEHNFYHLLELKLQWGKQRIDMVQQCLQ